MRALLLTSIFSFFITGVAGAAIITFNDLENPGRSVSIISSYSSQGFDITSPSGNDFLYWNQGDSRYNLSAAIFNGGPASPSFTDGITRISASNGSLFSLISLDLVTAQDTTAQPFGILIRGFQRGGHLEAQTSASVANDWSTYFFDSSFQNLEYVELYNWGNTPHQIDNIVLTPAYNVPLPSSVWMFFLSLTGLLSRKLR